MYSFCIRPSAAMALSAAAASEVYAYTITPLRYVFPEWTACQHVSKPLDFELINSAVMTGSVICMEPFCYQGSMDHPIYRKMSAYIKEVERIRAELKDVIFLGEYGDNLFAKITQVGASEKHPAAKEQRTLGGEVMVPGGTGSGTDHQTNCLHFRTHRTLDGSRLAMVVANSDPLAVSYLWQFDEDYEQEALLYAPFAEPRRVTAGETLNIPGIGLQILVTKRK